MSRLRLRLRLRLPMSSANIDVLDTMNNTPLHYASRNGHAEVVKLLLINGASVNSRNALGQTSLHMTAEIGHLTIAQLLLNSNADVHVTDQSNNTPIHIAAMHGHKELVHLLMNYCVLAICYGTSPIHLAAEHGHADVLRVLLNSIENPDATNSDGDTSLHLASRNGYLDVVEVLLRSNADANICNDSCMTHLQITAEMGDTEMNKAIIDHHSEVNASDRNDITAVHFAESTTKFVALTVASSISETHRHLYTQNSAELIPIDDSCDNLINRAEAGVMQDISAESEAGKMEDVQSVNEKENEQCLSQLQLAAERGDTEAVRSLLVSSANVDEKDTENNTPLHIATLNGQADIVNLLINKGANINSRNVFGQTSLHLAAEFGDTKVVRSLLKSSANADVRDTENNTPLHYASKNGHIDVVNLLLNKTVCVKSRNASGKTSHPLVTAKDHSKQDETFHIVNFQLSLSSAINAACKGQSTTNAELAEKSIYNSANINACNNDKMTPLHLACQKDHTSIVEVLLDNHAIVNVMKQTQETPLYLAARNGHADIADLLMRRNVCDFVVIPMVYKTPLHIAIDRDHTKVVEVILKHSRRIYEQLAEDVEKLTDNTKRGISPIELLKSDGRSVSAEIVWTEINTPLVMQKDKRGRVPLVLAAFSNNPKIVELLLPNIDECMFSETDIADIFCSLILEMDAKLRTKSKINKCRITFIKVVQFLMKLSKFNVNHQDEELNTFLHTVMTQNEENSCECCLRNDPNSPRTKNEIVNYVIKLLLEKGANFNAKNSYNETPLLIASKRGCCDVIRILFDWEEKSGRNLDFDTRDQYGATALIRAAQRLHVPVVQLLLSHGASVNLYDYYGYTALHAATCTYGPSTKWIDLQFFCSGFPKRKYNDDNSPEIRMGNKPGRGKETMDSRTLLGIHKQLKRFEKTARLREKIVKLLLANDETNVNAVDFRGNTPLDLVMKCSNPITPMTVEALKNRGAIRQFPKPEDVRMIYKRGRNPLHRLIISHMLDEASDDMTKGRLNSMVDGILLKPEKFRHLTTETDEKGRTPLHYTVFTPNKIHELTNLLLKLGSKVNAYDMYGKTPLHYADNKCRGTLSQYELLVQFGADENAKDNHGHTPKDLRQLRESVKVYKSVTSSLPITRLIFKWCIDDPSQLYSFHVTELMKRKEVETIRICSQSPRPEESSEEAIWKTWTECELFRLNRRLSKLKPSVQDFIERLADSINERDDRFECQAILVGSADEETKAKISADFDFNFKLIKFSQFCEAFPHPLGQKGYFQLRRKPSIDAKRQSDEKFDCFFNSDQCLLTKEVNSKFKILMEDVLQDSEIWQDENVLEWDVRHEVNSEELGGGMSQTLKLRMIHPLEDGEGDLLFVNISIDVVACIHIEDWRPDGIIPSVKANGSIMVFDGPRFGPFKPYGNRFPFSETIARISFSQLESVIIKESSPLIKAAYMICKLINHSCNNILVTTYQLKTCLLYCTEALDARNGSEAENEEELTPKQLAFWVERILCCFREFHRHRVFPCYFMPSFKLQVDRDCNYGILSNINKEENVERVLEYSKVDEVYLDLCPDDTATELIPRERLDANYDSNWELSDRDEFLRKLSSRCSN